MATKESEKRKEIVCKTAFELLHFLSHLTFEDMVDIVRTDEKILEKNIRVMRNNLINWMRQDNRFSLSDADGNEDVVLKLSAFGRKQVEGVTSKEKIGLIKHHLPSLLTKKAA